MRINKIQNINFREDNKSATAILMLRDPNAAVKFQQNQEYAKKADSVDSNPFVALGYKLYRTFNLSNEAEGAQTENKQFRAIA